MPDFREGPFKLAIHAFGVYAADGIARGIAPPSLLPEAAGEENVGKKKSENRGSRTIVGWLLAPLVALVFSETGRRRKRARAILKERYGMGEVKARFAYGQGLKKARSGSGMKAAAEGVVQLARDAVAAVLTLPLRLIFIAVGRTIGLIRKLKGEKALPPMK
jgi:hypothetical protein